jgi:hypothetical protein
MRRAKENKFTFVLCLFAWHTGHGGVKFAVNVGEDGIFWMDVMGRCLIYSCNRSSDVLVSCSPCLCFLKINERTNLWARSILWANIDIAEEKLKLSFPGQLNWSLVLVVLFRVSVLKQWATQNTPLISHYSSTFSGYYKALLLYSSLVFTPIFVTFKQTCEFHRKTDGCVAVTWTWHAVAPKLVYSTIGKLAFMTFTQLTLSLREQIQQLKRNWDFKLSINLCDVLWMYDCVRVIMTFS